MGEKSRIYTRTGDGGTTGLADGSRIDKESTRVAALGDVDELNAALGLLLTHPVPDPLRHELEQVQHDLFDLGAELAAAPGERVTPVWISRIEKAIDTFDAHLPPLREFILPGGGGAAATCHLARAICRRAERSVSALQRQDEVSPAALAYINRLSDLLFVSARLLARLEGVSEIRWRQNRSNE